MKIKLISLWEVTRCKLNKKNTMKTSLSTSILLISILVLTLSNTLSAINYNISFSTYGARNVYDYVVIENITQGLTATVPAGSTLNLVDVTAVGDLFADKSLSVYPNPVDKKAQVTFYSELGGITHFTIFGIDGKCIVKYSKVLDAGNNQFQISLPIGVFSLVVNENGIINTAKIISKSDNKTEFEFSGNKKTDYGVLKKNKSAVVQLKYNQGDILIMKAYSGNFVSILSDIFIENKNISFNLVECVDQEGNNYPVVTIGNQTWLAENLKTSRYRNNIALSNLTNNNSWGTTTNAAYSDYSSPSTSTTYGKLYNWYAVTNINNLAPKGWHIPTDEDWTKLSNFLGSTNVGSKLKERGNLHWLTENADANNQTGFTALPGGSRSTDGNLYDFGNIGYWWSSSVGSNINSGWYRYISNASGNLNTSFYNINAGMSVRCIMGDLPIVSTNSISSITATRFVSGGNVTFDGNLPIIFRGVCWSLNQNPTINNSKTSDLNGTGTFTSSVTGLSAQTTYYVRAYATNSYGTSYGEQLIVSTALPTVTTSAVSSIKATSASCGGTISLTTGASAITTRGVCWSTTQNPTINDSISSNSPGTGTFSSSITGLTAETTYYVRAYATSSVGTAYGTQVSFSTALATISTTSISSITAISASAGGNVTTIGGAAVTARGICWSTNPNPTIALSTKTSNGTGTGIFTNSITGLQAATTYYIRAYATNSIGTAYGNEVSFTTQDGIIRLTTNDFSAISAFSATFGGSISSDGGTTVTARGVCWSTIPNPTIVLSTKTSNGNGTGTFSSSITGLTAATKYYIRAYATNSIGTTYGNEVSFTTLDGIISLTTSDISAISAFSATSGGSISSDGGATVNTRGVCWSTTPNPTIALSTKTSNGNGKGTYLSSITNLSISTTYYIRAYATNSIGTVYGNQLSFTTIGTITDIEGNVYRIIKIGTQTWMAENLKTTKYKDGTAIPLVTDDTAWGALTSPGYCWYNNDAATNKSTYGALYNWHAVNTAKLAPTGWHVATDTEWTTLRNYVSEAKALAATTNWKSYSVTGTIGNNLTLNNSSGFTALPGGHRVSNGKSFSSEGIAGHWWSSTYTTDEAWGRFLGFSSTDLARVDYTRSSGFSVRCVKD